MHMKRTFGRWTAAICAAVLLAVSIPLSAGAQIDQTVGRMPTAPTTDGVLAKDEWGAPAFTFTRNYDISTSPGEAQTRPALDGAVYLGYDEGHFYVAVTAVYDKHENTASGNELWRGDAIQLQLSAPGRSDRRSFGFALTNDGVRGYQSGSHPATYEGQRGGDFFIARDEDTHTTTYELALPLAWFSTAESLKENGTVAFSLAVHMHEGYYYEWAGGIVTEKNIGQAALLTLGGDKDLTTPATENPGDTTQTQTRTITTGDVDANGSVDSSDARLVLQAAVGKFTAQEDTFLAADVDGSEQLDSSDARYILQFSVSKLAEFPIGNVITITTTIIIPAPKPTTLSPVGEEAGSTVASREELAKDYPTEGAPLYFALMTDQNDALPFNRVFAYADGRLTAVLPAGTDISAVVPTFDCGDATLEWEGAPLVSDVTVMDLREPQTLTLVVADGTRTELTVTLETLYTGLPSFSMTVENYETVVEKDLPLNARFTLSGGNPAVCEYAPSQTVTVAGTVKGRGNTSWMQPKKGYTVKLEKKTALLDMAESKNWALIANYEDKTLMRNVIAEYLAEEAGVDYIMNVRPVDLWYNGEYWGTYNLTEKVEIEPARVDITDYEEGMKAEETGYLLEFDGHVNEVPNSQKRQWQYPLGRDYPVYYDPVTDELFFQLPQDFTGKWVTIKKPSTKYTLNDPTLVKYIYDKVLDAAAALQSGDYNRVSSVLDVEAFTKWYLIEEYMNNAGSSMHSSVYMTLDVGGKFALGPVWDFDRSSGNCNYWNTEGAPDSLYNAGSAWFRYLYAMPQAREVLKREWAALKPSLESIEQVIEDTADMLYTSQQFNFRRWDILNRAVESNPTEVGNAQTYEAQVKLFKNYLLRRTAALDAFYKSL